MITNETLERINNPIFVYIIRRLKEENLLEDKNEPK
mgnify:FL=1